ncbi:MAG: DUF59 domain-containing protein [Planctomycetota bacterium]
MPEKPTDYKPSGSIKSLGVINTADAKLAELRDQSPTQSENPLNRQSLIDRALDDLSPEKRQLRERIIDALRTVYDPELPINLYDLGLIYRLDLDDAGHVDADMTLTSPACPVAGELPGEVERAIKSVEGVESATVQLVWEPRWGKQMMSEEALLELGML